VLMSPKRRKWSDVMSDVNISSTTDSAEDVQAAMGSLSAAKVEDKKSAPTQQNENGKSNLEDSETSEGDEETLDESNSEDNESDESDSKKRKAKTGYQRKIDKFRRELSEKEQRIAYLEGLSKRGSDEPAAKTESTIEKSADGKPNPDKFDTNAEYIDALTDWKIEQREIKAKTEAEKAKVLTEKQKVAETFQSRVSEFQKDHADFDEVIEACEVDLSKDLQGLIVESEIAPQLMYELAAKPEEIERLNKLSGLQLAKELGKLEFQLSKDSESKPKEKKHSKAPQPIKPVTRSGSTASTTPEDMSYEDYKKWREAK